MEFKKRLKYERYNGMESIITINLHNGYSIIALIGRDEDVFDVEFRIKENSVNKWDLIEDLEHVIIDATYKSIYSAILKKVSNFLDDGVFDYYIDRYEYELKCFDKGNDFYESQELN